MKPHDRIDFVCIGAAKSGTTWLFEMLRDHGDVWLPPEKELHYFNPWHGEFADRPNPQHGRSYAWYHGHFPDREDGRVIGEFSTSYLKYAEAAKLIHNYHPSIKLLVILRHPLDRAISHHAFLYAQGLPIPASFSQAYREWPTLLAHSLYYRQLEPYRQLFSPERLLVLRFDDIVRRPQYLVDQASDFLGISRFVPTRLHRVANPTLEVRDPTRHRRISNLRQTIDRSRLLRAAANRTGLSDYLGRLQRRNLRPAQRDGELEPQVRSDLRTFFRDDVDALRRAYPDTFDDWVL